MTKTAEKTTDTVKALLANTTINPAVKDEAIASFETRKALVLEKAREAGRKNVSGTLSLYQTCIDFQDACRDGSMQPANALEMYEAYISGQREMALSDAGKAQSAIDNVETKPKDQQVSRLRSYGMPGPVELGATLYSQVLAVRKMCQAEELGKVSATGNYYAVNVAINKLVDDAGGDTAGVVALMRDEVKSEAFIRECIVKAGAKVDPMKQFADTIKKCEALGKNAFVGHVDFARMLEVMKYVHGTMKPTVAKPDFF